jgi:hypothetical protein
MCSLICRRCGECCHYTDENGEKKKCRNLVLWGFIDDRKVYSCRIYSQRLGFEVTKGLFCTARINDKRIFKDCPYNH